MSCARRQEIKQRLSDLEKERNDLLLKLSALPPEIESSSLPQILGAAISNIPLTSSDERIALFTRLFRCREDVFPKLWENRLKGTKGYSPACQVEWVQGVCEKPKIKCSDCRYKVFIPFDKNVIRGHLEGNFTVGTYTIREDDSCMFLTRGCFIIIHWSTYQLV